jgi:hypothetical protein
MTLSRTRYWVAASLVCSVFAIAAFIHFQGVRATTEVRVNANSPALPQSVATPVSVTQKLPLKRQANSAVDWEREFNASSDYFSLVSKAARRAYAGDGRAAFYISNALYLCLPILREYSNSKDPQSDFDAGWSARTKAPQWVLEKARKDFQTCAGFLKADAFAGLPTRGVAITRFAIGLTNQSKMVTPSRKPSRLEPTF